MQAQFSQRLTNLPPFLAGEARKRVREARARGVDVISLGIGDPDGPTPPHVIEALASAAADPTNHKYPTEGSWGLPAYREAVARWYLRRFGVPLDAATEVLTLIGSKEANLHLALALLDPGDLAILPDPGFPSYQASVIMAGAHSLHVPLDPANDYLLDFDAIPAADAARAKLLWLSYPNNPTTAVAPLEFFERAVAFAHRHDVLLISDNPYSEIAFDGVRPASILQVDGARDVAVEFNSLSKTFNMAGWRIGMAVGNRSAINALGRSKEQGDTGVFNAVQYAGIAALDGPQDSVAAGNAAYARRRDIAVRGLRDVGLTVAAPKATFYVWAGLPSRTSSSAFAARVFDACGVVVMPGVGYGEHGEGYVRISLALPDERLDEAMQRMVGAADRILAGELSTA